MVLHRPVELAPITGQVVWRQFHMSGLRAPMSRLVEGSGHVAAGISINSQNRVGHFLLIPFYIAQICETE
jgi:hypothetical protein